MTNTTYTKEELVSMLVTDFGQTKKLAREMVDAIVTSCADNLMQGREVSLYGLGSLKIVPTAAKTGRNPQTGGKVAIEAGHKVKFSAAKAVKDAVKNLGK